MPEIIIETNALSKQFGSKSALNDCTLSIKRGGVTAIVGSNGAGKSTLFRLLLGLLTPSSGDAHILGESCQALSPEIRGKIGYVNEEHTLPTWMLVGEVEAMQRALYPQWNDAIYQEVVSHFDVIPQQKVGSLSRGERAGFNLSMALAQSPEVLILDEPTLGLDVVAKQAFLESLMFSAMDDFNRQRSTIIYCSHQMDEIERVADHLVILEDGQLKHHSSPDDFLAKVSFWTAAFADDFRAIDHPSILSQRVIDGQHHVFCFEQDNDFAKKLTELGATRTQQGPVSLDQAVNAFLTRNHHGASFNRAA